VKAFPCGTATYLQTPASPHVWGLFLRRSSGLVLRFPRRPLKGEQPPADLIRDFYAQFSDEDVGGEAS
jgi:hypothetical protein